MENFDIKLTERQKDLINFLSEYFKENKRITPCILAKKLDINFITAYEHLRNLKEKGILKIEFEKVGKGRPKYFYTLTLQGRVFLYGSRKIDEYKKFLNEFEKAKSEGKVNEFIKEKLKILTSKTIKPLLYVVLGFLLISTLFSNTKEFETLKEFLILSSTSKIVFLGFITYLFFLLTKFFDDFKGFESYWEDIKFNFINLKDEEREEIVNLLISYLNGGDKNGY
ncbi:MAG: helix-turn-helix transcriptional regulator [Caldisericia bacterium]|jgi:predicted transcriptional regulator|nr:helix-turn-helix transcriptional regulator [Caldisericia bacterium]